MSCNHMTMERPCPHCDHDRQRAAARVELQAECERHALIRGDNDHLRAETAALKAARDAAEAMAATQAETIAAVRKRAEAAEAEIATLREAAEIGDMRRRALAAQRDAAEAQRNEALQLCKDETRRAQTFERERDVAIAALERRIEERESFTLVTVVNVLDRMGADELRAWATSRIAWLDARSAF